MDGFISLLVVEGIVAAKNLNNFTLASSILLNFSAIRVHTSEPYNGVGIEMDM